MLISNAAISHRTTILVLLVIIVLAFLSDKIMEWMGRQMFPHREVTR